MALEQDNLLIYEFVHTGDVDVYKRKINRELDKINTVVFYLNNIIVNNDYKSAITCKNLSDWVAENKLDPKFYADYPYRSCDPLLFNYELVNGVLDNNKNMELENYNHNDMRYNSIKNSLMQLNLRSDNELTVFIIEVLILPELNIINFFDKAHERNSIYTNNYTLKAQSISSESFVNTMNEFIELYRDIEHHEQFRNNIDRINRDLENDINVNYFDSQENRLIYITKLFINTEAEICFFGDIHGSIHSVLRSILRLKVLGYINENYILKENFHIIFLGDLVDRNIYGIECLYFIMKLKLLNRNNIHIIRGNHEECCTSTIYNLKSEFKKLDIVNSDIIYRQYCKTWLYLPVAIFLKKSNTNQYIQLCHGAVFRDINVITDFLINVNNIMTFVPIPDNNSITDFQWGDFIPKNLDERDLDTRVNNGIYGFSQDIRREYCINEINKYMELSNIRAIIRGHQDDKDNTKLLFNDFSNKVLSKIESFITYVNKLLRASHITKEEHTILLNNIKSSDPISSFTIPLPSNSSSILDYYNKYKFSPVITLSTGIPSRGVDCDGFAILKWNYNLEISGGSKNNKYLKYKTKYLNLKKNK